MEYQNITKVSNNSQQNNSENVTNEEDKKLPKERYISPEEIQNIVDNLRSIKSMTMEYPTIINLLDNKRNQ